MGSSRVLMWIGVLVSITGVVALIWTQTQSGLIAGVGARWYLAMTPTIVFALGVLINIAAQVLAHMQTRDVPPTVWPN